MQLINYNSRAIRRAVQEIHPNCINLMCYFHAVYNAKKKLQQKEKKLRDYVVSTTRLLHECCLVELRLEDQRKEKTDMIPSLRLK